MMSTLCLKHVEAWNKHIVKQIVCINLVKYWDKKQCKILDTAVRKNCLYIYTNTHTQFSRSQWPRSLRRRSTAARLLRSWVRIPPETWMFVCCECCVLSGRVLYDELITRPEESYRMWCVVMCDLQTSRMRRPWPALGRSTTRGKK